MLVWDGVTGSAFQNYQCLSAGSKYAWTFVGPSAEINNLNRFPTQHVFHSAVRVGPNPTPQWMSIYDDSLVQGNVIARASGQSGAIPMLLLKSIANYGVGTFTHVNFIQRLDTAGGLAPTSSCSATNNGQTVGVPYSAHYDFYAPEPADGD